MSVLDSQAETRWGEPRARAALLRPRTIPAASIGRAGGGGAVGRRDQKAPPFEVVSIGANVVLVLGLLVAVELVLEVTLRLRLLPLHGQCRDTGLSHIDVERQGKGRIPSLILESGTT